MEKRKFENLIIDGEDMIVYGNIEISDNLTIKGADLIVSGCITFTGDKPCINITNGGISAEAIYDEPDTTVVNGDIYVSGLLCVDDIVSSGGGDIICDELESNDIYSDGDIITNGNARTGDVSCLNYLVSGDNDSTTIAAIQDIYILGESDSWDLQARDIFITYANLNDHGITAFGAVCIESMENCSYLDIGW